MFYYLCLRDFAVTVHFLAFMVNLIEYKLSSYFFIIGNSRIDIFTPWTDISIPLDYKHRKKCPSQCQTKLIY